MRVLIWRGPWPGSKRKRKKSGHLTAASAESRIGQPRRLKVPRDSFFPFTFGLQEAEGDGIDRAPRGITFGRLGVSTRFRPASGVEASCVGWDQHCQIGGKHTGFQYRPKRVLIERTCSNNGVCACVWCVGLLLVLQKRSETIGTVDSRVCENNSNTRSWTTIRPI
ncbi:hypothetical protein LY78DRAFT_138770 [Colletotrichum sublineola]|nr:hypothetical protein LY78DRAFT_138770 [Colletotrichum sublineola]